MNTCLSLIYLNTPVEQIEINQAKKAGDFNG